VVAILKDIDFSFLGMNLSQRPQWNFFATVDWGDVSSWFPAFALFLVPFLSAGLSFLASKLGQKNNPSMEMSGQSTAKTMMLTMPLVSLYICFVMPAAMGVYWIVQSLLSCFEELVLGKYYRRALEKENAQFLERERRREEELEKKREETERLKAEGKTAVNPNTSKRKKQTAERAREEERQAAARAAQRAAEGKNKPVPDSQVGARRFARGRAYIKDRYEQTGDDIEIRDAEGLPDGEIESAAKAAEGYPVSQEDSAAENEYETDAPESEESFDSGDSDGDDQERS
jgi:YidC/Oxa1 family membrane protein insertase